MLGNLLGAASCGDGIVPSHQMYLVEVSSLWRDVAMDACESAGRGFVKHGDGMVEFCQMYLVEISSLWRDVSMNA